MRRGRRGAWGDRKERVNEMKYEGVRDKWEEMIGRSGERVMKESRVEKWEMRRRSTWGGRGRREQEQRGGWGEGRMEGRSGRRGEHDKRVRREGV